MAVFTSNLHGGGVQRSIVNLVHGLAAEGHLVDLVLVKAEGPLLQQVRDPVRVVDLNANRALLSVPALVRYIRRELPVAMLSALNYINIIAILSRNIARSDTRLVVSEHNTLSTSIGEMNGSKTWVVPRLVKRLYPLADGRVAVSKGVAEDLTIVTGISPEHIQVIYNPVIDDRMWAAAKAPLDHPWFKPGEPPVVLAAGRLTAQKDFQILLRAFAKVRKKRPSRLLILGEGDDRFELEALLKELGISREVSIPGFVENPYAYMARCALFVLSSRWEGLPTALIEALACGAPIVSTDCPSGPREILADGQFGHLVPVGDADEMAQAIEAALVSERAVPPPNSWRPFELHTVVDQYSRVLLGL